MNSPRAALAVAALLAAAVAAPGCTTTAAIVGGVVGATVVGGRTNASQIEQTYYLGVLDPQEQVPPMFYRLRVRGQASLISSVKFASGWVPANLIDSLGTNVNTRDGTTAGSPLGANGTPAFQTGRRLVMFGPEGFREAPREHRLAIGMGSSPQAFFDAIKGALGDLAEVEIEQTDAMTTTKLMRRLYAARDEQRELQTIATAETAERAARTGGTQ